MFSDACIIMVTRDFLAESPWLFLGLFLSCLLRPSLGRMLGTSGTDVGSFVLTVVAHGS